MALLAQNTFSVKRLLKEPLSLEFSSDTIAIPASSAGVANLTDAEFSVRVLKDSKELFPVFDESIGERNLLKQSENLTYSYYPGAWAYTFFANIEYGNGITAKVTQNWVGAGAGAVGIGVLTYTGRPLDHSKLRNGAFTISFDFKSNRAVDFFIDVYASQGYSLVDRNVLKGASGWQRLWMTFTTNNVDYTDFYFYLFAYNVNMYINDEMSIRRVKLEKGTVPTAWTPAPEELLSTAIIAPHNCTAVVIGDKIKLTTLTPGKDTGYVDVEVSYGESHKAKRRFTWARVKDGESVDDIDVGGDNLAERSLLTIEAGANNNMFALIKGDTSSTPLSPKLLKNNTEYVLHIGKSEKISGSATVFTFKLWDFVANSWWVDTDYPFTSNKTIIYFKTPATGNWSAIIYAGKSGSTAGNKVKFSDVMLQEGNKATAFIPPMRYLTEAIENDGTTIEGGLVLANVLGTKDVTGEVKSYMSGLRNNETAFAAGVQNFGTELETKNVDIRHDGSAKIGVFEIDPNGNIQIRDLDYSYLLRLLIKQSLLPTLSELLNSTVYTGEQSFYGTYQSLYGIQEYILTGASNSLYVPYNNSELKVELSVTISAEFIGNYEVVIVVEREQPVGGYSTFSTIASLFTTDTEVYNINKTIYGVAAGNYRIKLYANYSILAYLNVVSPKLSYIKSNDIRRIEIGSNGMMLFYNVGGVKNYLHMTEEDGLVAGGKIDIPAGLGGANINNAGTVSKNWGKITSVGSVSRSGNNYTITHNIGDTDYSIILSPSSSSVPYWSSKNNNTIVVTCAGGFDFILIRTK
ncbi:MAG: hypothetical protein BGO29_07525 [Bacteroidales bacterium 36-12]|nr:MAG: hypothetical protein BGO29_07525 [Bacteroidales bacterium 36-12]